MGQEIERKFLVIGNYKEFSKESFGVKQGYLSTVPERNVRIRLKGEKGFITIKGIANNSGITRYEWEKEISKKDAIELLQICEEGIIDKTRHLVEFGVHTFEVDEFHGKNEGLIVAEIELRSEDEKFEKPKWIGKEVTGNLNYYNSMLSKNPYLNWK